MLVEHSTCCLLTLTQWDFMCFELIYLSRSSPLFHIKPFKPGFD
jgi:hypothetical protein